MEAFALKELIIPSFEWLGTFKFVISYIGTNVYTPKSQPSHYRKEEKS